LKLLVGPDRHEQEESDRAAGGELVVGDAVGHNDGVRVEATSARDEQSMKVLEQTLAIAQVIDGVVAQQDIERLVWKRQGIGRVRMAKPDSVLYSLPLRSCRSS
jgi:hypothetical protein